jgi:hypothetical protein
MTYNSRAAEQFWKSFHAWPDIQKESTREAWQVFKLDPFDPRLRTHKIHSLTALCKRTIYTNVPKLLDVCKIRGNGRPARFLSDCTGETPMPPVRTKSLPAKGRWYYSVTVESDLRVVFFIEGNTIFTVDIGTHDICRV